MGSGKLIYDADGSGGLMYLNSRFRNFDGTYQYEETDLGKLVCEGDYPGYVWMRGVYDGWPRKEEYVATHHVNVYDPTVPAIPTGDWLTLAKAAYYGGAADISAAFYGDVKTWWRPPWPAYPIGYYVDTYTAFKIYALAPGDNRTTSAFAGCPIDRLGVSISGTDDPGWLTVSGAHPAKLALIELDYSGGRSAFDPFIMMGFSDIVTQGSWTVTSRGDYVIDISSRGLVVDASKMLAVYAWYENILPPSSNTSWNVRVANVDYRIKVDY